MIYVNVEFLVLYWTARKQMSQLFNVKFLEMSYLRIKKLHCQRILTVGLLSGVIIQQKSLSIDFVL